LFVWEVFYPWMQEEVLFNTFLCLNTSTFEERNSVLLSVIYVYRLNNIYEDCDP